MTGLNLDCLERPPRRSTTGLPYSVIVSHTETETKGATRRCGLPQAAAGPQLALFGCYTSYETFRHGVQVSRPRACSRCACTGSGCCAPQRWCRTCVWWMPLLAAACARFDSGGGGGTHGGRRGKAVAVATALAAAPVAARAVMINTHCQRRLQQELRAGGGADIASARVAAAQMTPAEVAATLQPAACAAAVPHGSTPSTRTSARLRHASHALLVTLCVMCRRLHPGMHPRATRHRHR
jgi:hypothetical protein